MVRRYTRARWSLRGSGPDSPEAPLNPKFFRNGIVMLALVVVALAVAITLVGQSTPSTADSDYSVFLDEVRKGSVQTFIQEGVDAAREDQRPALNYTVDRARACSPTRCCRT